MALILAPVLLLCPLPQEVPLVQGAYRGPYDEVLIEQARARESVLLDGWERWEFWFEHEQAGLFRGPVEAAPSALQADGRYAPRNDALRRGVVSEAAAPLLLRALESPLPELREAAALSLGRCGLPSSADALIAAADDPIAQVRQAALLGLGLLRNDQALVELGERFTNPGLTLGDRSFAALGLGLSRRAEAVPFLAAALERDLRADRLAGEEEKLLQATIWACGLLGSSDLVATLMTRTEELERTAASASRRVRTLTLWALGAIGDASATSFLVNRLSHPDLAVQRSAAQALGRLRDPGALGGLAERLDQGGDLQARVFCFLAVGRIGGPAAARVLEGHTDAVRVNRQLHSAWGLAAGMAGASSLMDGIFAELISGPDLDPWDAKGGSRSVSDPRRDEERMRGALAMGLALYGDAALVEDLGTLIRRKGIDPDFAGYLCTAAGYLGGSKAAAVLQEAAASSLTQEDTRRGLATGLALVGHPESAARCVELLLDPTEAPSVRLAAARAQGLARFGQSMRRILDALELDLGSPALAERNAHLLLAVGYLGDPYRGDRLASALEGWNFRQEFRLMRCLASY